MNKTLLDTDILSEILKGKNADIIKRAGDYRAAFGQYTVSVITITEIVKGFHKIQREDHIRSEISAKILEEPYISDIPSDFNFAAISSACFRSKSRGE